MQRVVDSYHEYGGKWSGSITHEIRPGALIFQDDELVQVLKALRRGSKKDKLLAKKAFYKLTGLSRCPQCGKLTSLHVYDGTDNSWCCEKCHLANRLKIGWSISKSEALKYFTRKEYEELCSKAGFKCVKLLKYADEFYGEEIAQDILDCM